MWFGKSSGSDPVNMELSPGTGPTHSIKHDQYFGEWQLVVVSKRGSLMESRFYSPKIGKVVLSRSVASTGSSTEPNKFVTQHGYDLKLAGFDNQYGCGAWYRDLMFFKEALTEDDIDKLYTRTMSLRKGRFTETILGGNLVESAPF